jgi:hypothetical protein
VGCSTGSKGEVPGVRKAEIRDDDDDDDDNLNTFTWKRKCKIFA